MVSVRWHEVRAAPVEWSGRAVTLVGAQVVASLVTPWFGVAASYRFPRRVEIEGDADAAVSIRDHVMVARNAGVALIAVAGLLRRRG